MPAVGFTLLHFTQWYYQCSRLVRQWPEPTETMERADLVALIAAIWLAGATIWAIRSIRAGRSLASELETRYPDLHAQLGAPRPTYLPSVRRNRWFLYVMQQEFLSLDDSNLVRRFEKHRAAERVALTVLILSLFATGLLVWWLRRAA